MSNNADAPGEANSSGDDPGDLAAPVNTPVEIGVDERTLSSDAADAVSDQLATSPRERSRQQRALRRAYNNRKMPSWVKYIPWVIFPVYGFMRLADPNYEEHFAQWQKEQRRNYLGDESQ
jgi:hypothetical protein